MNVVCSRCQAVAAAGARFCASCGAVVSLQPGTVVGGRYEVVAPLGAGGMGQVYRAVHIALGRPVALKLLDGEVDARAVQRFQREAQAASRLVHPNVTATLDFDSTGPRPFLVMELVEGRPLDRIVAEEAPLPPGRALALARQIALGLGAAHAAGIVHRDVKPANAIVTVVDGREVVKVVDFGLALFAGAGHTKLTTQGVALGTPTYVSPEQVTGRDVEAPADVYSLGVTLYELLVGQPPFVDANPMLVASRHAYEPAPAPSRTIPSLPQPVDALVLWLLAKAPADRPPNGNVAAAAIADLLARLDGPALALASTEPTSTAQTRAAGETRDLGRASALAGALADTARVDRDEEAAALRALDRAILRKFAD